MISLFRIQDLTHNEKKWLKGVLDARLGLAMGVDVNFASQVSEALSSQVVVAIGGSSRAILMNQSPQSDISCRGLVEGFADRVIVTTWGLTEVIRDTKCAKDFLVDLFKARIYAYGMGNRNTGFIDSVKMSGTDEVPDLFDTAGFEKVVLTFEQALGA